MMFGFLFFFLLVLVLNVVLDDHNHSNPNNLREDPDCDDGKDPDPDDRNCPVPDDQYGSDHPDDVGFLFFGWCLC